MPLIYEYTSPSYSPLDPLIGAWWSSILAAEKEVLKRATGVDCRTVTDYTDATRRYLIDHPPPPANRPPPPKETGCPSNMTLMAWMEYQIDHPYEKLYRKYHDLKKVKAIRDPTVAPLQSKLKDAQEKLAKARADIARLEKTCSDLGQRVTSLERHVATAAADNYVITKRLRAVTKLQPAAAAATATVARIKKK